jgi:hypothetical protein
MIKEVLKHIGYAILDLLRFAVIGFTLTYLWIWFVVPVFNVGEISIYQAMGLVIIISLLFTKTPDPNKKIDVTLIVVTSITSAIVCLGFGWLIHQCII